MTTLDNTQSTLLESWITENMEKVRRIARKYADWLKHSEVEDLVQEGLIGVMDSYQRYGVLDTGYLLTAARSAMIGYIQSGGDDLLNRYKGCNHASGNNIDVSLLSAPLGGYEDFTLADILKAPVPHNEPEQSYKALYKALDRLTEAQRIAICMVYALPGYGKYTALEAGKVLGLKAKAVDNRVHKAKRNLQRDKNLIEGLGKMQAAKSRREVVNGSLEAPLEAN